MKKSSEEYFLTLLKQSEANLETAFLLGKLAGNSISITLGEVARIDVSLIEEVRD